MVRFTYSIALSRTHPDNTFEYWGSTNQGAVVFDGTNLITSTSSGSISLNPFSALLQFPGATGTGSPRILHRSANTGTASYELGESSATSFAIKANASFDQAMMMVTASTGEQIVIGDNVHSAKDYDHVAQTNPTMFIHSAVDPDTNNTQWLSLTHDQTNAIITSGAATR